MRKISSIFFIAFYALIATSFSVNLHYCLGELANIEVYGEHNTCCCGEEEMTGCCDNELVVLEATEEQIPSNNNLNVNPYVSIVEVQYDIADPLFITADREITIDGDFSPPGDRPLWLVNCKLILYG